MQIAQLMEKMTVRSDGNVHDIDHSVRVWAYAKAIGKLESLDSGTQFILEIAAITHDIARPFCREKYGNTNGKHQEEEGAPLVRAFLADSGPDAAQIDRVASKRSGVLTLNGSISGLQCVTAGRLRAFFGGLRTMEDA